MMELDYSRLYHRLTVATEAKQELWLLIFQSLH